MSTDQELFNRASYALLSGHNVTFERGPRVPHSTANLLRDLQKIETESPPERWPDELRKIAKLYNLNMPE